MAPHADSDHPQEPLWAVFSKPWAGEAPGPLGERLAGLGFGGAEVPVRPGAYVDPGSAGRLLPGFVRTLAEQGVTVISVAADPTEPVFAACAEAGVPLIRIMAPLGDDGYLASTERLRRDWAAVQPLTERYGVRVGVQPHRGRFVESTLGVLQLIDDLAGFDLVWDAGHDALTGVDPVLTLDLAWPRLGLVNLKNGHYRPEPDAGPGAPRYRHWWGPADSGMADWARILGHLRHRGWDRPVCLTAEYSEPSDPEGKAELVRADLLAARGHWTV
ncbi:sugar phosphate isomerase/epimerase family protein [Microlunatus sp. GCM10028923]|uniref:sugar phosphate isomerase/epimerase family protein n=1 Tax=Microlunatus sp. GCM10028923 TaxID=3273400 RepID=UPI003609CC44